MKWFIIKIMLITLVFLAILNYISYYLSFEESYSKYSHCFIDESEMVTVDYFNARDSLSKKEVRSIRQYLVKTDYKEAIQLVDTIDSAKVYLTAVLNHGGKKIDQINYGQSDYAASFRRVHEFKVDDCDGGAIAACALLSDNGFPPYVLNMVDHVVFIYKTEDGSYGSLGLNEVDNRFPTFNDVKSLVRYIQGYDAPYKICDLNKIHPDFIHNNKNNIVYISTVNSWLCYKFKKKIHKISESYEKVKRKINRNIIVFKDRLRNNSSNNERLTINGNPNYPTKYINLKEQNKFIIGYGHRLSR